MHVGLIIHAPDAQLGRMMRWADLLAQDTNVSAQDFVHHCHTIANEDFRRAFDSQGSSIGSSWAPLKESTQRIREATGYAPGRPIHVRSGALLRTMTDPSAQGHSWKVTLNKRAGRVMGKLRLKHSASRSASLRSKGRGGRKGGEVSNLIDELTFSNDRRRVSRPLYDAHGYGVSKAAVNEMNRAFQKWALYLWKKLERMAG